MDPEVDWSGEQQQQQPEPAMRGQVKKVTIQKDPDKPLGMTIMKDGDSIVISRIVSGGICDRTGLLRVGDTLLAIDDSSLEGRELNVVYEYLQQLFGRLTFSIMRETDVRAQAQGTGDLVLKALFSYHPSEDSLCPCKELGLAFNRRDIIHVVNRNDPNWWQGYKEGDDEGTLARIFPSPKFRKESYEISRSAWYERQGRLLPQPLRRRPLVLVGPPGVGRHELRVRLIESDPDRFAAAVPHTTRQPRTEEEDEVDYWFVRQADFQQLKSRGAFIETWKFNGDLYGTSVDSVRRVMGDGKVCVLALQPEGLEFLRTHPSRLMPYAVFVNQPDIERLRTLRQELSAFWESARHNLPDEELHRIVDQGKRLEVMSGHVFDLVLEHAKLTTAYNRLREKVLQLENTNVRQWVPASWVQDGSAEPGQQSDTEF